MQVQNTDYLEFPFIPEDSSAGILPIVLLEIGLTSSESDYGGRVVIALGRHD